MAPFPKGERPEQKQRLMRALSTPNINVQGTPLQVLFSAGDQSYSMELSQSTGAMHLSSISLNETLLTMH